MPSAYTYKVTTGKITELREFILECSRAFRIEAYDNNGELDKFRSMDPYYVESKIEAIHEHQKWVSLTETEKFHRFLEYRNESKTYHTNQINSYEIVKSRCQDMQNKVRKLTVPGKLDELKNFMLTQLHDAIRFDCDSFYHKQALIKLDSENYEDYKKRHEAELSNKIKYATEAFDREQANVNISNEWLATLYKTLETI